MDEVLKIKVGADISEAVKELNTLEKTVDKTTTEIASDLSTTIPDAARATEEAIKKTGNSIGTLSVNTEKASGVLTSFGSAVQRMTKIRIGNDFVLVGQSVEQLKNHFKELEQQLSTATGSEVGRLNTQLDKLATIIQRVKSVGKVGFNEFGERLKPLPAAVNNTVRAIEKLPAATNRTTQAISSLGKVISDAPFGFIAISNNIEPALESFKRLAAESGGRLLPALRTLGAALIGPAGITVGIGAIIALSTAATAKYGSLGKAFAVLTGKAKELTEEQKRHAEQLKSIGDQLGQEASRVAVLASAIQSETLTRQERLGAIKELQKINPKYFGDLKDEEGLVNKLTSAYNAYVTSLRQQFAAKALDKRIAELFDKKLNLELGLDQQTKNKLSSDLGGVTAAEAKKFSELLKKPLLELTDEENKFLQKFRNRQLGAGVFKMDNEQEKQLEALNRQIDELLFKRQGLGNFEIEIAKEKAAKDIKEIEDKLKSSLVKLPIEVTVLDSGVEIATGKTKSILSQLTGQIRPVEKSFQELLDTGISIAPVIKEIDTSLALQSAKTGAANMDELIKRMKEAFGAGKVNPDDAINAQIKELQGQLELMKRLGGGVIPSDLKGKADEVRAAIAELNLELSKNATLISAIGGLFQESFEAALISGKSFISSFINGLKQLIVRLVAAAATAALLAAVIGGVSGGTGSAGFGASFMKLFGNFSGMKGIGGVSSPSSPSVAAASPMEGNVRFILEGQQLVGVINRTNNANRFNG